MIGRWHINMYSKFSSNSEEKECHQLLVLSTDKRENRLVLSSVSRSSGKPVE